MKAGYIPKRYSDRNTFVANFKEKLIKHAETLRINPDDVTEISEIIDTYRKLYSNMIKQNANAKATAAKFRIYGKTAIKEVRRLSQLIKGSQNYTAAIGKDLKIIGTEIVVPDSSQKKPELKVSVIADKVEIRFKKGNNKAINIYSKRGDETKFRFLRTNLKVRYLDSREKLDKKKPEQREYYAYFVEKDKETGKASDVVKVIVP